MASSLLWTGIDLFMGFVLGPILRRVGLPVRREIMRRLTPRTLFLMPDGVDHRRHLGLVPGGGARLHGAAVAGLCRAAAALVLVTLMTIQGLGFLTPVNVIVCLELQKAEPDMKRISGLMQKYFYAVALQGTMQVAILIVMTRFRTGI